MTTTFRAKFVKGKLVPQEPVDLPQDELLHVQIRRPRRASKKKTALQQLAEQLAKYPPPANSPGDLAAQHDHYLYRTPKRRNP